MANKKSQQVQSKKENLSLQEMEFNCISDIARLQGTKKKKLKNKTVVNQKLANVKTLNQKV